MLFFALTLFSCEKKENSIFGGKENEEYEDYIPLESIEIQPESIESFSGRVYGAVVKFTPSTATNKEYSIGSSDSNVATVEKGYNKPSQIFVYLNAPGICELTLTAEEGGLTVTCPITVLPCPLEEINIEKKEYELGLLESCQLKYNFVPEYAAEEELIWESSDERVVVVDDRGIITGLSKGEATITVHTVDKHVSASCEVKVVAKLVGQYMPVDNVYANFKLDILENDNGVFTGKLWFTVTNKTTEFVYTNYAEIWSENKLVERIELDSTRIPVGLSFFMPYEINRIYKPKCIVSFTYRNREYIVEHSFGLNNSWISD